MNIKVSYKKFVNKINRNINQFLGWRTHRKIVVIESDDWGAIRMPNIKAYNNLLNAGIPVDKCEYCRFDTLADKYDFEALFNILSSIKNDFGQNPKFTANTIVANPDFKKIKEDNYQNYYYETIEKTFEYYPNRSLKYWLEGIKNNLFKPQLHGREHVNIERWLISLQNNSKEMKLAFNNKMYGLSKSITRESNHSYLEALNISEDKIEKHITDSVEIFKNLFGFNPETFIAPNYYWDDYAEQTLRKNNIYCIQGGNKRKSNKYINHYLGEKNINNQYYLIRNVNFEPTFWRNNNLIEKTFSDIQHKLLNNIPAIICSHRVNYIGALSETNRKNNLRHLKYLLEKIITTFPDVEFMYSDELYRVIKNEIAIKS